jgi:hypothetical protein
MARGDPEAPPAIGSNPPQKEEKRKRILRLCKTYPGVYHASVKTVGRRRPRAEVSALTPEEALTRAAILQHQAELLNPYPRPRGFVFKARTREEYERWRQAQENPRLW